MLIPVIPLYKNYQKECCLKIEVTTVLKETLGRLYFLNTDYVFTEEMPQIPEREIILVEELFMLNHTTVLYPQVLKAKWSRGPLGFAL